MGAPLAFFHCVRSDSVPNVELFGGSDVKSRTRFGASSTALQPLAFCTSNCDEPSSLIGPLRFSGPGAPRLWLAPALSLVLGFAGAGARLTRGLAYGLAGVLLVDIALVAGPYLTAQRQATRELTEQLHQLARAGDEARVSFQSFRSNRVRLREAGVRYQELDRDACADHRLLIGSTTRVCGQRLSMRMIRWKDDSAT